MGDRDTKRLYRIGAGSGIALGVGYIGIIGMYVPIGAPPKGIEERLIYLAAHTAEWWWILGLSVATDLLFVPLALALYMALREVSRSVMLLATAFVVLFVFLDLAITWTNYAALITLSGRFAGAVSPAEKSVVVATAQYPAIVLQSGLLFFYNSLTLGIGLLLTGFAMLKGGFGKASSWLGIGAGGVAIVAVVGSFFIQSMNASIILASALTMIWAMVVGYQLYMRGRE